MRAADLERNVEIGDRNGRPVSTIRQLTVIMFDEEIGGGVNIDKSKLS